MAAKDIMPKAYEDPKRIFINISPDISGLGNNLDDYKSAFKSVIPFYNNYANNPPPSFAIDRDDIALWARVFRGSYALYFRISPNGVIVANERPISDIRNIITNATGTEMGTELRSTTLPITQLTYEVGGNVDGITFSVYPYEEALSYIFTKTPMEKYDHFVFYIEKDKPLVILQIRNSEIISIFLVAPKVTA